MGDAKQTVDFGLTVDLDQLTQIRGGDFSLKQTAAQLACWTAHMTNKSLHMPCGKWQVMPMS